MQIAMARTEGLSREAARRATSDYCIGHNPLLFAAVARVVCAEAKEFYVPVILRTLFRNLHGLAGPFSPFVRSVKHETGGVFRAPSTVFPPAGM